MEFIEGAKIDDKETLARLGINRNRVSQELCKIFSEQVYIHGYFHADPHAGKCPVRSHHNVTESLDRESPNTTLQPQQ
jgi:aarF domain-containing kinase